MTLGKWAYIPSETRSQSLAIRTKAILLKCRNLLKETAFFICLVALCGSEGPAETSGRPMRCCWGKEHVMIKHSAWACGAMAVLPWVGVLVVFQIAVSSSG